MTACADAPALKGRSDRTAGGVALARRISASAVGGGSVKTMVVPAFGLLEI
jgi:hypothetical protein